MNSCVVSCPTDGTISRCDQPFRLLFSADPFPDALSAELQREELGGAYYRFEEREGWLCPALFRYFDAPPARLYVRAEELGGSEEPSPQWASRAT